MRAPGLIHMSRGSDWSDTATFDAGLPDLATASALVLVIKNSLADPDVDALISRSLGSGVTVTGEASATFAVPAAEIDAALPVGHYLYEVRATFGASTIRTDHGAVRVAPGGPNG
jgi:hypothetical protein